MKEKEAMKLYDSITNIDIGYIEEAQEFPIIKNNKSGIWLKWAALAACFCLIASIFYFSKDKIYYPEITNKNTAISCEWKRSFDNLQELYENSDLVVYADVIEDPININKGLGFVKTKIKINEVLKGDLAEQKIYIMEDGNINKDGSDHSIEGIPLLKKNMKAVLFLYKNAELKDANADFYYSVLAPLPGKFFLDENMKIHHSSELTSNGELAETQFKQFSGKTYKEFKKDILELKK